MNSIKNLEELGYNVTFEAFRLEQTLENQITGRVIAEHKERYIVLTLQGEFEAEITGNMRFTAKSREELPAVGDWVSLIPYDADFAIIHQILPRFSTIKRPAVGQFGEIQIIATNIDYAFIVQAADRDFNINRLERYLTLCNSSKVSPIIVLSKTDLIDKVRHQDIIESINARIKDVPILSISNETQSGYEALKALIMKGCTYCMLGSSGVGKSTLLNNLSGKSIMKTSAISSSTNKGRHITSHRELVLLEKGGILIDNPGMREVGIADAANGLEITFDTIVQLSKSCKFKDCTHTYEVGCSVLDAVSTGVLDRASYENYLKMEKEKEYFDSTIAERRKKDKSFGKMVKNYKQQMKTLLLATLLTGSLLISAQEAEKNTISAIYKNALTSYDAYNNLNELCTKAPGRLVGSKASELAIQLLKAQVEKLNPDTVYLQKYTTPSWRCKTPAQAVVFYDSKKEVLNVINLGLSPSTPDKGISGEIVEVQSFDEMDSLGSKGLKDKIVFINKAMDNSPNQIFKSYGETVELRFSGASKASQYGASGVIIRSLATEPNDFPHTGVSHFEKGIKEVPNLSISTNDANKLSRINKQNKGVKVWIKSSTETIKAAQTANIIAEIKGSVHPEKIILFGAHMDAWFNTQGAHDDGAGCEQMIDVFRIFRTLNIKPVNTIRLVLYMDEEMYQSGAKEYAALAGREKREHIACIESDAGGALPIGFGIDSDNDNTVLSIMKQTAALVDFGIYVTDKSHAGVDIGPLKEYGYPLIGLSTNPQRYFEFHHSANDTFNQVSRREMQLGTAAIASLVYLIDKNGI